MPIDLAGGRFIQDDGTFAGLAGATAASRHVGGTTTGAPASGTFAVGDFAIANDGAVWICTVAGTPGTWVQAATNAATNLAATGTITGTSASASALAVGRQGATSPALDVDASTASSVTGVKVKAGASGGGAAVSVVGGATDEALTVDAKGAGTLTLNGTATGGITLARATAVSGVATFAKPVVHTPAVVSVLTIDVTASSVHTKSIAGDSTFTASAVGTAGQMLTLIITVDGTQRAATFGTNVNSSGTMTIPASKVGVIQFVSDGTAWREAGRSINT